VDPAALNLTTQVLGYGRFLFLELAPSDADSALLRALESAGADLENAHFSEGPPTAATMARGRLQYLRRDPTRFRANDIEDAGVAASPAAVRLEGDAAEPLNAYEQRVRALIEARGGRVHVHAGVRKDRSYTSFAMTQFAYASALAPARGDRHGLAVFLPQRKTAEWWTMDWMRRESFFLPRYDDQGRLAVAGHTLASAEGIPYLMRRLYHRPEGYGLESGYDFLGYFEFAEKHAPVFERVMQRLRDAEQNPEWRYVREGPEWWARRVGSAEELW
jgi:hypothetical protein